MYEPNRRPEHVWSKRVSTVTRPWQIENMKQWFFLFFINSIKSLWLTPILCHASYLCWRGSGIVWLSWGLVESALSQDLNIHPILTSLAVLPPAKLHLPSNSIHLRRTMWAQNTGVCLWPAWCCICKVWYITKAVIAEKIGQGVDEEDCTCSHVPCGHQELWTPSHQVTKRKVVIPPVFRG